MAPSTQNSSTQMVNVELLETLWHLPLLLQWKRCNSDRVHGELASFFGVLWVCFCVPDKPNYPYQICTGCLNLSEQATECKYREVVVTLHGSICVFGGTDMKLCNLPTNKPLVVT